MTLMETTTYKGVIVRKNYATDRSMIKDCLSNYASFSFDENSVVLDLGAYVGGFAKMVLKGAFKSYTAVEADAENYSLLKLNATNEKCLLLFGAASAGNEETVTFAQTKAGNSKCSGCVSTKKQTKNKIYNVLKNYNIDVLLETFKPTHVKVDIEGAEWKWFEQNKGILPSHIKQISFELHSLKGCQLFEEQYFDNIAKDFNLVKITPNVGFIKTKGIPSTNTWDLPKFGVKGIGTCFGVDCFWVRK